MRTLIIFLFLLSTVDLKAQGNFKGIWLLNNYVDSTLISKSIHKYSGNPASYCYQIMIDSNNPTEIELTGYHEGGPIPILERNNNEMKVGYDENQFFTITLLNSTTLSFKEGKLESAKNIRIDPRTHFFHLSEHPISDLNTFFNSIIQGTYINEQNVQITFDVSGSLNGLLNFKSFELTIDFGEHPPGNFDSILLNSSSGDSEYRIWSIVNNKLTLCELEQTIDDNSGWYNYTPTENCWTLIKK
jgi:hypothetical protein